jgi:Rap1a immunity proteins
MVTSANRLRCVTLAFLATAMPVTAASAYTVKQLYDQCSSSDLAPSFYCWGYISGIAAPMFAYGNSWRRDQIRSLTIVGIACSEEDSRPDQWVQSFRIWAESHPQNWEHTALSGVQQAISSTWPCR